MYLPARNLLGILLPTLLLGWYFIDRLAGRWWARGLVILACVALLAIVAVISTRTRTTRQSFFWGLYDRLTGNGVLPLRLVTGAIVTAITLALLLHCAGLRHTDGSRPADFVRCLVEVDLYWVLLNFLGLSDDLIRPTGPARSLTLLATFCGIMFWGMYISILVNKHVWMQDRARGGGLTEDADPILYGEPATATPATPAPRPASAAGPAPPTFGARESMHEANRWEVPRGSSFILAVAAAGILFWSLVVSMIVVVLLVRA